MTLAPLDRRDLVMALPMPRAAPVTRQDFPSSTDGDGGAAEAMPASSKRGFNVLVCSHNLPGGDLHALQCGIIS